MNSQDFLSLEEAAKGLKKSAQTVRRMIKRGELPAKRVRTPQGFNYVVSRDDVFTQAIEEVKGGVTVEEVAKMSGIEVRPGAGLGSSSIPEMRQAHSVESGNASAKAAESAGFVVASDSEASIGAVAAPVSVVSPGHVVPAESEATPEFVAAPGSVVSTGSEAATGADATIRHGASLPFPLPPLPAHESQTSHTVESTSMPLEVFTENDFCRVEPHSLETYMAIIELQHKEKMALIKVLENLQAELGASVLNIGVLREHVLRERIEQGKSFWNCMRGWLKRKWKFN